MIFGLWFVNVLFYVTAIVLLLQGGGALARKLELDESTVGVFLVIGAVIFAPAIASLVHLPILVPFAAYPFFHANDRRMLPWNLAFAFLTSVVTFLVYNRRLAAQRSAGAES